MEIGSGQGRDGSSRRTGEIFFAGGCFWGVEKLFRSLPGVVETQCGYANGKDGTAPSYDAVRAGGTGFKEAVRVVYDPSAARLEKLLEVYFFAIDPTVSGRQGGDVGPQYQTGIYWTDEETGRLVEALAGEERRHRAAFAVETGPLRNFHPAEEYHQNYLGKNPGAYCHIPPWKFKIAARIYAEPAPQAIRRSLTPLQRSVTEEAGTEEPFTGEYWDFFGEGIYVDVTTGEPLFSSTAKFPCSCGWPAFSAPIDEGSLVYLEDLSIPGRRRTEVRSRVGNAHLGHVFQGDPESPIGTRYCINSAALRFVPRSKMEEEGYGALKALFER